MPPPASLARQSSGMEQALPGLPDLQLQPPRIQQHSMEGAVQGRASWAEDRLLGGGE